MTLHNVPTDQNPADLGSRGRDITNNRLWPRGPSWLSDKAERPPDIIIEPGPEKAKEESKCIRRVQALKTFKPSRDKFDKLLKTYWLRKVLRIGAWIQRLVHNRRRNRSNREYGPLNTAEIKEQTIWWVKRLQQEAVNSGEIENMKLLLNLQPNDAEVLERRGRIAGEYPMFLPKTAPSQKRSWSALISPHFTGERPQPWHKSESGNGYQSYDGQ